jgi:predicted alpha/beta-fold hydrolase
MQGYKPPLWLPSGHAQTIYAALSAKFIKYPQINWRRTRIKTRDQDFIDIDWSTNALNKKYLCVMFHGLEGSSKSHYAKAFGDYYLNQEGGLCIPHFRGCSGEINAAPRAYHSGDFEEIGWILAKIRELYEGPIWAVGVSLGGNALLRWAQEYGEEAGKFVSGIASICAPLDLIASGMEIGRGVNKYIYERHFLKTMKAKAVSKAVQYPGLFDLQMVLNAKSLFEFDNYFTAPLHGFKDTTQYWSMCSSHRKLQDIQVKHLVLNALNDPFIPAKSLPARGEFNKYGVAIYTKQGGHVGYPQSTFPGNLRYLPELISAWMKS